MGADSALTRWDLLGLVVLPFLTLVVGGVAVYRDFRKSSGGSGVIEALILGGALLGISVSSFFAAWDAANSNANLMKGNRDLLKGNEDLRSEVARLQKELAQTRELIEAIRLDQGDDQLFERYLEMLHRNHFESSEADAKAAVDRIMASQPERQERARDLAQATTKVVQQLRVKWDPLIDFAVARFDSLADELESRGIVGRVSKGAFGPAVVGAEAPNEQGGGSHRARFGPMLDQGQRRVLILSLEPGRVRAGQLEHEPVLTLSYQVSGPTSQTGHLFSLRLRPSEAELATDLPSLYYTAATDDPYADAKLKEHIVKALNEGFGEMTRQATTDSSE